VTRRRTSANKHRRSVNRRSGLFPGRRFGLVLVLTLAALGGSAAVAGADSGSSPLVTATVYSSSGTSPDSVTVAALQANPGQCPTYQGQSMNELGRQGFVPVTLAQNATWSLPTILSCLQTPIPVGAVTGVTVINAGGSPELGSGSQLTPADLAPSGSDFNNSSEYPVVQALGSVNQYDRPWRGSPQGQPDYDYLDEVQVSQPITMEVFEGPHLTVRVKASRTTVPVGKTVSFTASVTGADDSSLSYNWNFGGGAPNSTAPAPKAAFNAAGQYDVTLQVTDTAGGGGGAKIPLTVGAQVPARTESHKQTGAGKNRKSHSPTGPQKSSGNHPGGSAGNNKSETTSTKTKSSGQTSTTTNSSSTTSTSTATTPSHPAAAAAPTHPTSSRSPTHHSPPRTPRIIKPPPVTPSLGPLVTGQEISDVVALPAGASPLVHSVPAPAASAPPARQATRASRLPALAAALGVALLLGLGAVRELRGRRGWAALRPSS
jgi:PKD repeat protein